MRKHLRCALLSLAAMMAVSNTLSFAADGRPAASAANEISPGQIDSRASRVFIMVGKTGLGHEHGIEGRIKSGFVTLGAPTNAGHIVFDATTFQADTPEARQRVGLEGTTDADTAAPGKCQHAGGRRPRREALSDCNIQNSFQPAAPRTAPNAPPQYELEGKFTLHGTTRKLKLIAEAYSATGRVRIRGDFSIWQSESGSLPTARPSAPLASPID